MMGRHPPRPRAFLWPPAALTITNIALYAYTLRGGERRFQLEPLPTNLKVALLDQRVFQVSGN